MLNHDKLLCLATKDELIDDGIILENPASKSPALLRTIFRSDTLHVRESLPGIFRFSDWLPISRILESQGYPVTYRSKALANSLGLTNLYITFNGYWPEIGAMMTTGTFKECEAYSVCARMPERCGMALVVASAGNTARAFMKVASENQIPLVIVIPEKNLSSLWSLGVIDPCVKIIAAGGDSDYYDAINLAGIICKFEGFISEGGAKNVARRDGMGTTVLSAATTMERIPDYYFQAIGSGTGAIAAYESNLRLNRCKHYGNKTMRLMVSQNLPFAPMYRAWMKGSRSLDPQNEEEAFLQIGRIDAKVLSNRHPPYGILGGLYDALKDTAGDIFAVENTDIREAQAMFMETEGRDICPEAGVALASLKKCVLEKRIEKDAFIMLNITGGGIKAIFRDYDVLHVLPNMVINKNEFDMETVGNKIKDLF